MANADVRARLTMLLARDSRRGARAMDIAETIREAGSHRWVGIYDVDARRGVVSNIAWTGPNAPIHPIFPITGGITSRVITGRKTVNVGNVAKDPDYLTALPNTRAEIIVPVLNGAADRVIGTIDVESDRIDAFDAAVQALLEEWASVIQGLWN